MSKPIILKIAPLKRLGIFKDCTASEAFTLRRYNLIYGFNGSGKTTLSRVFGSLEAGSLHRDLPDGGTFNIELSDGTIVKSTGDLGILKGRLLVFNVDFVEENFKWKEGTANPVFHLGREQVELAKTLEKTIAQRAKIDERLRAIGADFSSKNKAFINYKRDAARIIAERLGLGRKYDASNLSNDYSKHVYDKTHILPDEERHALRTVLTREAPLAKINPLGAVSLNSSALVSEVRMILDATLGDLTIEDLRGHDSMLNWINDGVIYHQEHDLTSCLFCGHGLMKERLQILRGIMDNKFEQFTRAIAAAKTKAEVLRNSCAAIATAIPSSNDISQPLRTRFIAIVDELTASHLAHTETAKVILKLLAQKLAAPNSRIDSSALVKVPRAAARDELINRKIIDFNNIITLHNVEYHNFDSVKATASKKLKEHYLSVEQTTYSTYHAEEKDAETKLDQLKTEQASLNKEEERIKKEVRTHGPAAKLISEMVQSYLGHGALEVAALEDGYELRRSGKPVKGSLSEGEKTAITLCYFLSTLEAEGRERKDLIVVVDDPVSSLDTKALNYAFSILKSALGNVGQLFLLTHNLNFMNEAKKWLKNRTKKIDDAEPTATFLFLHTVQKDGEEGLSSSIQELPKYIRDYESEYQYLFHLILQFAQSPDGLKGYLYVMPNAMRKVLEIFLAFKFPGSEGLGSKIDAIAKFPHGLDPGRIRALDRLVQLESHADNLDDLVTFSSMTVEETKDAADVLLKMMNALDGEHYQRLHRICYG